MTVVRLGNLLMLAATVFRAVAVLAIGRAIAVVVLAIGAHRFPALNHRRLDAFPPLQLR